MPVLTEGFHPFEFVATEANGRRSRENVTLLSGQVVVAGEVLGKVTASGKYVSCNQDAGDGSDTALAISGVHADATAGDMTIPVLARHAEVNRSELTFNAANDAGEIAELIGDLAVVGIIVRPAV